MVPSIFKLLNLFLSCISFLHYFPFYKLIEKCLELFCTHLYSLQFNHICQLKTFSYFTHSIASNCIPRDTL